MSNALNFSGPIGVGLLSSNPPNPREGQIYFNTSAGEFRMFQNGSFRAIDAEVLGAHIDGAANKHDASEIDVETAANFTTVADLETNLSALDTAIQVNLDGIAANAGGTLEVQLVSTANLSLTGEQTIDGTLTSTSRVLLTGQTAPAENGIYVTAAGAWARAADLNESSEFSVGRLIVVREGTLSGDTIWANQAAVATVDTTAVDIDQVIDPQVTLNSTHRTSDGSDHSDVVANTAKVSADGSVTSHSDVTDAGSGIIISDAERTKLSGVEALADVTDSTNVEAAGAVMESDTTTAPMGFVVDEDSMVSDLATKVPTQQSVKAHVATEIASALASEMTFKGDYNAATNTPDLDATPIATAVGDMYVVTAAGTFFTTAVEIGDVLIAETLNATTEAEWTIVNKNLDAASIKTAYESNADTNEFSDAEQTLLGNQSGTNTGDEVSSSTTVEGVIELATQTEVNTGTDALRAVTPATLENSTQLAAKLENISEDATPSLGGDLTLSANTIIHDGDGMKRGPSSSNFLEEEYIHAISLAASTTAVISELTFAHASFEGMEITYKLKEATTNEVRIGTIRIATNGTDTVLNDVSTDTADLGVSFSAIVNGANVEVSHTNDTNIVTMRCDVKRIKA